ncbi:MAG TPA: hydroxyacid-oxoacid transhydrogenase [Nannocystaceae bacterium]|nr:hydroxyacid-oxoacid transhydrogenase [Nannocystaceae bacterium]
MACRHEQLIDAGFESAFTVDASRITFGRGCLHEVGERAVALGMKRVALFTDGALHRLAHFECVRSSLVRASLEVVVFDDVSIEPTDVAVREAVRFAVDARPDGYVSLGGGSVMDTCKLANLVATHPAELMDYVNAPIGAGHVVPGPLAPHIACPTTCGTGSEVTGIAIFDVRALQVKTGVASPRLRPSEALVDPECTSTLPPQVVAASGLDVLSHALESYTARPYTERERARARPMSQGRNPWSDLGCERALRILGTSLVHDADDHEARERLMWAATLAGIAFGNAGVHAPHAMAYAVAGLVRDHHTPGYPGDHPLVPHGISVVVNAPAVFRATASACPERHLEAAGWLGADIRGATPNDAGEVLATRLVEIMRALAMPNGIGGVGYVAADIPALVTRTQAQQRLLVNAPRALALDRLFASALCYW